jgi:hypothetical protein
MPMSGCTHESISPSYSRSQSQPTIAQSTYTMTPIEDGNSNVLEGAILKSDGTILNYEVTLYCVPVDPKIYLTPGDPSVSALTVKSYGVYVIAGLPPGEYYLGARDKNNALFTDNFTRVKVDEGFSTSQNLILIPGGSIAGNVDGITTEMRKFARFRILWNILVESNWLYWGGQDYISEDNTFLLKNIPPGRIQLRLNNGYDKGSSRAEDTIITVKSGEQVQQNFLIKK